MFDRWRKRLRAQAAEQEVHSGPATLSITDLLSKTKSRWLFQPTRKVRVSSKTGFITRLYFICIFITQNKRKFRWLWLRNSSRFYVRHNVHHVSFDWIHRLIYIARFKWLCRPSWFIIFLFLFLPLFSISLLTQQQQQKCMSMDWKV